MPIRSPTQFANLYLTSSGQWPNNTTGTITPERLREGIQDTWDSFVNQDIVNSGLLHDQIDTVTSGYIAADLALSGTLDLTISNTSGTLNTEIGTVSGNLNTKLSNASGTLHNEISGASGTLNTSIGTVNTNWLNGSGTLNDKITTLSGNFAYYATTTALSNASGVLNNKIDTLSGNFTNYAATTVLSNASGTLNTKIDTLSGNFSNYSLTTHNHGLGTSGFIPKYTSASGYANSLISESGTSITISGILVLPKASGNGIMVDTTNPTYGWKDLLSPMSLAQGGAHAPAWGVWSGNFYTYLFDAGPLDDEVMAFFHLPHDYKLGTAIYPHVHWAPTTTATGVVMWGFEYTYAKGHNQANFPSGYITYASGIIPAGGGLLGRHMITETTDANAIPSTNLEVDGLIIMRIFRRGSSALDTYPDNVAGLFVDLHYQSTHVPTKNKAPNFYT